MIKFSKIINDEIGLCEVGTGSNSEFYESIGMSAQDVAQSDIDGQWYISEKCPKKSEEEKLLEAKTQKQAENLEKAYIAEQNGLISFKEALIETTTANISKLTSQFAMLSAGIIESVQWLSKDDIQLELNAEDLIALGQAIAEYTGAVWNVHYLAFKDSILSAASLEEIEAIVIDYAAVQESVGNT